MPVWIPHCSGGGVIVVVSGGVGGAGVGVVVNGGAVPVNFL